ncbi:MAG: hypothetical protein WBG90_02290 [Saonia sp.]
MDLKKIGLLLLLCLNGYLGIAQLKIGDNPSNIDAASIVELESTSKTLVLTRVSNTQMQNISPLRGALVYNIDSQCVHYYNGTQWTNLCDGSQSTFSFADNGDGTYTLTDGNGNNITLNGAPETVTSLVDNLDGTYTYTNEAGIETIVASDNTDNQNITSDGTPGNIGIDNGNTLVLNVDDGDADDTNEIQDLQFNAGIISLSDDPDATNIDLSNYDTDGGDDFSGSFNDLTDIPADIADGDDVIDGDADDTNEIQTLSKTGTTIALSNGGGSINETVTTLSQDNGTGVITYTDESNTPETANVVSTDADNSISVGSDGGAYVAVYEKIVIWAEENAALANNQLEWSFGNGATGRIGIPLPEAWEAYAVSFNADSNGASDSVLMAVIDSNTNTNLFTFTATGNANNMVYTEMLTTPVAIPVGTSIGFRTVTETGNVTDARVAVFLRRRP